MELVHLYSYCFFFLFYSLFSQIFSYFLHCHTIAQEKIMTAKEFAQMPNFNFANSFTTNGFKRPATRVAIFTWPLWMTIFERSSKLWRTIRL